MQFPNFNDGGVHALLRSAVHDYRGAFGRECAYRRETDSSGGARHQYSFACQLQIREPFFPSALSCVSGAIHYSLGIAFKYAMAVE
jgi:hypothetical protein